MKTNETTNSLHAAYMDAVRREYAASRTLTEANWRVQNTPPDNNLAEETAWDTAWQASQDAHRDTRAAWAAWQTSLTIVTTTVNDAITDAMRKAELDRQFPRDKAEK